MGTGSGSEHEAVTDALIRHRRMIVAVATSSVGTTDQLGARSVRWTRSRSRSS